MHVFTTSNGITIDIVKCPQTYTTILHDKKSQTYTMYRMHVHIGNTDYVHTNCIQIIIQYIVEYVREYILNVTI